MSPLPPGPRPGRLVGTTAFLRDPRGALRVARRAYGDVVSMSLATTGPIVVDMSQGATDRLAAADPGRARAGVARRRIIPMASPVSMFGGDDEAHVAARAALAPAFAQERIVMLRPEVRELAERHVASWPTGRPTRLLPRMRRFADDVFVRHVLGVGDDVRARAIVEAIGALLWTPGNPPVTIPARDEGLVGRAVELGFRRRRARLGRLLAAELAQARPGGDTILSLRAGEKPARFVDEVLIVLGAAQEPMAAGLTWAALQAARAGGPSRGASPAAEWRAFAEDTLRRTPPAFGMLRTLTAPMEAGGFLLPEGALVAAPLADPAGGVSSRCPFGGGARRCPGEDLAYVELGAMLPALFEEHRVIPAWRPERMVLRGTIQVPHRSGLVVLRRSGSARPGSHVV